MLLIFSFPYRRLDIPTNISEPTSVFITYTKQSLLKMRYTYLIIAFLTANPAARNPTLASSATSPTYSCPPISAAGLDFGKTVLLCCKNGSLGVVGANTVTSTNCALATDGVGNTGKCEDATKPIAVCCGVVVGYLPYLLELLSLTQALSGWPASARGNHSDSLRRARPNLRAGCSWLGVSRHELYGIML